MNYKQEIEIHEASIERLTIVFASKYFKDYVYDNTDWVGNEIGGVICINDYWFNFDDILGYLKHKYSAKKMFEHYDYALDRKEKGKTVVNIKNYKKLKK